MNALETIFAAALDTSWRASCLVLLALGLRRLLRGRVPARVVFWVWLAVALRMLVPVSLPTAWSPFNLAAWRHGPGTGLHSPPASVAPVSLDPALSDVAAPPTSQSHAFAAIPRLSLAQWAAFLWLAGAVSLLVARRFASGRFARKVRRSAVPVPAAVLPADVAGELAARGVSVLVSDAVSAPALHGIFRPRIIFPPGFVEKLSPSEMRLTLAHELAHAERRDLLADAFLHAAVIVHWFNPLAWLAARLARHDCELACDEAVMRRANEAERERYGAVLLKIARLTLAAPPPRFGLGVVAGQTQIKRRIQMIIAHPTFSSSRALLCAAVFALVTGLSFTSETTAQVPPAPAVAVPASEPPAAAPADANAPNAPAIVYNPAVDRLDHLYPGGVAATIGSRDITVVEVRREIGPLIPSLQRSVRTQEEFNDKLTMLQNEAIKNLVNRAMLIQQFHDRREGEPPRQIAPAHVDAQIDEERKMRFDDDRQKFLEYLHQRGQTMSDYRKEVEEGIIVSYMRGQERKLAARPGAPKTPTPDPEKPLHLRIIQLSRTSGETDATLLEKANAILKRLAQGETFAQLATEFDQSKRQAKGGDWGWVGPADFKGAFRDTAMALAKGAASTPILIPEGCFLLYAEDRR